MPCFIDFLEFLCRAMQADAAFKRSDKAPKQCTIDQIKQKKAKLMALLD